MTLDEYWAQLKGTGWLKSVPTPQHKMLKLRIAKALKAGDGWKGLVTGGYDVECIENEGDYVRLLEAYSEASYGKFKPKVVKDSLDIENGKATIRFTLKGKSFRRSFEQNGDTVSEEFDAVLNGILEKARIAERFFQLPSDDQVANLTFVRPAALRKAVAAGLVPAEALGDEDEDEDAEPWKPHADPSGRLRGRLTRAQVTAQPFQVWNEFFMLCGNPGTRPPYAAMTSTQRPAWLAFEYELLMMSPESESPDSHRHYFARVAPAHVSETLDALRLLGADVHFRVLEEAQRRFAAGARDEEYSDLDNTIRDAEPNLEHYLEKYLAQHAEDFVLIED
jgi:hypothetical protein